VLIVCEGEQTERLYFESLKADRRLTNAEVVVHGPSESGGTHPRNIVDYARDCKKQAEQERNPFDQIWCVFDEDTHGELENVRETARARKFDVAYSNPCFEVWLILHHEYTARPMTAKEAEARLRKHIDGYHKSMDVYYLLCDIQPQAMKNADLLKKHHDGASSGRPENPSTSVDLLVQELNALAEQ